MKKVIVWIVSVFCIILGLFTNPFGIWNITFLGAGLAILPPVVKKIEEVTDRYTKKRKWILFAILLMISWTIVPVNETAAENVVENKNIIVNEIIEENEKNEIDENILENEVIENTVEKNEIIENEVVENTQIENTTTVSSEPKTTPPTKTPSANKNISGTSSSSQSSNSEKNSETTTKPSNSSTASNSSSESSKPSTPSAPSSSSGSSSSSSSTATNGKTVYKTPTGKRYHLDPDCGGKNSKPTTLNDAKSLGLTPCQKCAM